MKQSLKLSLKVSSVTRVTKTTEDDEKENFSTVLQPTKEDSAVTGVTIRTQNEEFHVGEVLELTLLKAQKSIRDYRK